MKANNVSRRRFLKLLAAGAGSAALAACKAAPQATEAPPTPTPAPATPEATKPPTPTPVPTPTPRPVAAEQVEIVWWDGNAFEEYMAFWDEMIQGYPDEHEGVAVTTVHAKGFDAFITAMAGGVGPDIYFMWDGVEPLGSWILQELVLPLDDSMAAAGYDPDDMIPGAIESVQYQGQIWGIPLLADVMIEQRNLNHYREAGLPLDVPATIEDLYAHGEALTERDGDGNITRLGLSLPNWNWPLWQWIWLWGGSLWDEDSKQVTPDHPGVVRAVEELTKQYEKYGPENLSRFYSSQGQGFSAEDPFVVGNVSLVTDGDWMFDVMMRYAPDQTFGEDWDAFPMPTSADVPEGKMACHISPYPTVLSSGSKNPEKAFDVMIWMQGLERTVKAGAYMANVPQTKSALEAALERKVGAPGWETAIQFALSSTNQHAFPVTPISAEYGDRLVQEIDLVVNGGNTAQDAMTALKDELQMSLQQVIQ